MASKASKATQKKPCMCECHSDNSEYLFEFFPCCYFPNRKYISIKGKVDESRFPKLKYPRKTKKKQNNL